MAEILLLEDSPSLRRIVTRYLSDAGHDVHAFADGAASRDRAVLDGIDVVVTDLSMPGTDGRKALHNIGVMRPGLPAILMTGVERFADPVLDTAYGYLQKPFPEEDLLEMIDAALRDSGDAGCSMESDIESRSATASPAMPERAGAESVAPAGFCAPLPPALAPAPRTGWIGARVRRWLSG